MKPLTLTDRRMLAVRVINIYRDKIIEYNNSVKKSKEYKEFIDRIDERRVIQIGKLIEEKSKEVQKLNEEIKSLRETLKDHLMNYGIIKEGQRHTLYDKTNNDLVKMIKTGLAYKELPFKKVPNNVVHAAWDNRVDELATRLLDFTDLGTANAVQRLSDMLLEQDGIENESSFNPL